MAKDSFILYLEHKEIFEMLNNEEAGRLIKAIFEFEDTGQVSGLDKSLQIAFIPIKNALNRNKEKYESVCERNRENGKLGGRPKKPKNPSGFSENRRKPKKADNEHDRDNEHEKDNRNHASDSCVDGLQDVIDFYNNNVGQLTPYGLKLMESYVEEMGKEVVIYAMQISVEADKRTMQYVKAILNNWSKKGIKTLVEAQKESKMKVRKQEDMEFNKRQNNWDDLYDN